MNIVFLHCHFEPGGVTAVVQNQVAALADQIDGRLFLASGPRCGGLKKETLDRVSLLTVQELEYDVLLPSENTRLHLETRGARIAERLTSLLEQHSVAPGESILHWHNHSLGKNVAIPQAIAQLRDQTEFRQLLQVHDFAEDFRPENLGRLISAVNEQITSELIPRKNANCTAENTTENTAENLERYLYPRGDSIHYATLTQADRQVLAHQGFHADRMNVLPNCVSLGPSQRPDADESLDKLRKAAGLPSDSRWCVYPVRGIRRKNVGEFLLLSQLLPEDTFAGITLPPATDIERRSYERWRSVANEVAPRAVFDAGTFDGVTFQENLAASRYILSPSAAEGFGMAYLEPWLAGRSVIARRLSNVVDDFVDAGVRLDRFYDHLLIPGDRHWVQACQTETAAAFENAWQLLPDPFRPVLSKTGNASTTSVDFATLVPSRQMKVLKRISSDRSFQSAVVDANADLVSWLSLDSDEQTIAWNQDVIRSRYSLASTGQELTELYDGISASKASIETSTQPQTQSGVSLARTTQSSVDLISGSRPFFPCRTETEIIQ